MGHYTDGLTLDEQIGQILAVGFPGTTPSQEIIDLVQNNHIGSVILFSRNIHDARQTLALTNSLQMLAQEARQPFPLLVMADQENGIVHRLGPDATTFPGNMALGATCSEDMTRAVARATGEELRSVGINMNLAPVADVNNNPANPVIGVRSFGEDAPQIARFVAAAVQGAHDAGMICTLKHFPGHGDTAIDSHLALPTIPYGMQRLQTLELIPFKSGIAAGADCVMTAHIAFPAITGQDTLPATVSPAIVRGLLRQQLGFDGVIISDCLEMDAVAETIGVERAAVLALQSGIDLVLVSHRPDRQRAAFAAIRAAALSGALARETITEAAERVLHLKARYLSWQIIPALPSADVPVPVSSASHQRLSEEAYALSTTLVRNEDALVPLRLASTARILVISTRRSTMTKVEDKTYSDELLAALLRQYCPRVDIVSISSLAPDDSGMASLQASTTADVIVMATVNAHLDRWQTRLMLYLVQSGRRVIGIAARNPYDLLAFPQLHTYIATYEYTQPALAAAARVLFGEQEATGRLPVSLPGLYPCGYRWEG
jgi:beta-N-acetylhexosaminidase